MNAELPLLKNGEHNSENESTIDPCHTPLKCMRLRRIHLRHRFHILHFHRKFSKYDLNHEYIGHGSEFSNKLLKQQK